MSHHTLTLDIPDNLYDRLAERAARSQRSVADEALAAMALNVPTEDDLTPALARVLHDLNALDDTQLRRAAERTLSQRDERHLRALSRRNSASEITPVEADELAVLLDRLEDIGLIRAKATALLHARGHEVGDAQPLH
jgi:hypothetical protein